MIFDYIDGAAGAGRGVDLHRTALDSVRLRTRVLRDVSKVSTEVSLFSQSIAQPFGIAPMALCNLAHPGADVALARLAAKSGMPLGVSTAASTPLEKLLEMSEGKAWFQLYFSGEGTGSFKLAERARSAGYKTLVLTVDVPVLGRRPRELRHGFKMPFRLGPRQVLDFALHPRWSLAMLAAGRPEMANFQMDGFAFDREESRAKADWSVFDRLREIWPGELVVKGVLDPDDAVALRDRGVDAVWVSSHGGRQLDSAPLPIQALPRIRTAVGPDLPLFFDSGLRSGDDILRALALGANFTFLGRPWQFALATAGPSGPAMIASVLQTELSGAMAQAGITDLGLQSLQSLILQR